MVNHYSNNQPTFRSSVVRYLNGHTRGVEVEAVHTGADSHAPAQQLRSLGILHAVFVRAIRQAVLDEQAARGLPRSSRDALDRRTVGLVHIFNRDTSNGQIASFETRQAIRLNEITVDLLGTLVALLIKSNEEVLVTSLIWTFYFAEDSFIAGGAPANIKPPAWIASRCFAPTWCGQGADVRCIAFALVYAMATKEQRKSRYIAAMRLRAISLADECRWNEPTTAAFDVADFVRVRPTYKVIIIVPMFKILDDYTFTGRAYTPTIDPQTGRDSHLIYIAFDAAQNHYGLVESATNTLRRFHNTNNILFCATCSTRHRDTQVCRCDGSVPTQKQLGNKCFTCGMRECAAGCAKQCKICLATRGTNHRCLVYDSATRAPQVFLSPGDAEVREPPPPPNPSSSSKQGTAKEGQYRLYVYDIEAAIEGINEEHTIDFGTTEDGSFAMSGGESNEVVVFDSTPNRHVPVMVVYRDVFDPGSEVILTGPDCLREFIVRMTNLNHGRNIVIAHNGSGYDSRHIVEAAARLTSVQMGVVPRGMKFMEVTLGLNTHFRDSLLHLPGSLANLAKGFFGADSGIVKGYFPHLFHKASNFGYVGPIPAKRYFDMAFCAKTAEALRDFNDWHASWAGRDWDFDAELLKYCRNDVEILAKLVLTYHEMLFAKYNISPWFSMTAPSYVHKAVIRAVSAGYELPDPGGDREEFAEAVRHTAWERGWGVAAANEYWFTRGALRGGRTEVRKFLHTISDEEWVRGVRISYIDIVSMYPYCQIAYPYPVGLPEIYIYDQDLFPCYAHASPSDGSNFVEPTCGCDFAERKRRVDRRLNIFERYDAAPTVEGILADESFFGIVCASMTPPAHLFSPPLVLWDEKAGKCIASLLPMKYARLTTPEFKMALREGYRLDALHRLDKYKAAPGLWNDFIKPLYIEKMASSETCPDLATQTDLVEAYSRDPFNMGEEVRASFPTWASAPAKRQVVKILLNCGWGKHCEKIYRDSLRFLDEDSASGELSSRNFMADVVDGSLKCKNITLVGNKTLLQCAHSSSNREPPLHGGYLVAGVFVPAYGRLMLYEQLRRLGQRVLYHDTDSIIYVSDPRLYNVAQSDVWGGWSEEKFGPKNGGIREFVALAPKSYGLRAANGASCVKVKGLSLKLAHESLVNFDEMKRLVERFRDFGETPTINVPQFNFAYCVGQGIKTTHTAKKLQFQPTLLKGVVMDGGVTLYPFGYTPAPSSPCQPVNPNT